jgi:type VI secretion system protein ImpL
MKQILVKVLKGLLLLTLALLALLLVFGLVLLIGWPWWVGFFVLLGLGGLIIGLLVVRKYFKRRREQLFVQQIIAQDESSQSRLAPQEQDAAKELQARWKEAIEALRKSHLRKYGNPLYVLPWYMVIGESGSGKTTAIQSARLSSPFAQATRASGISGTRNCDWWFFEQAIFIDTAGRYAIPVDEGRDKEEWQKFLGLLSRFRKQEPLNGLVVTVAADHLAQNTPETLQEDGRSIRRRIDELMRVLGAKFPVYVLVTKCDLIQGATQFCDRLPEKALNQAMGMLNQKLDAEARSLTEKAFRMVGDRLRDLRLLLLNKVKDSATAPAMLLFPEELEKLQEPMAAFIDGAFQENPYQESPLFRGLFFSSGRQEGTPFSHFLNALGLIQGREVLAGTSKGLFLHDLFGKILPSDRRLFMPTQHMAQWNRLTRNMGLTAWIAVMVAVCGLLSYAFVKNLNALSDVRHEFSRAGILQGDLTADVISMDRFRQAITKVETENRNWWIPRLGLNASLKAEKDLKLKFVAMFRNGFQSEFDRTMGERLTHFDARTPNRQFGAYVALLVRRINMLKARLDQQDLSQLAALPQPGFNSEVLMRQGIIPEIQAKLAQQYLYAVTWQPDGDQLNKEIAFLQTWLKHLLTLPDVTLNWLVDWVDEDPGIKPLRLNDFWGGTPHDEPALVRGAFTQAGRERIQAAMGEIEAALFDPLIIAGAKVAFNKWYQQAYIKAWQSFIQAFDQGEKELKGHEAWQAVAKRLPSDQGPYFVLLDRVAQEFDKFSEHAEVPAWVGLVYDWQNIRREAQASDVVDPSKSGILSKATRSVASGIAKAEMALGVKNRTPIKPEDRLVAAKAYLAFKKALEETAKATESRNLAFQMAADLYQQDPATGQAPLLAAKRALDEIQAAAGQVQDESEGLFWTLVNGNIQFMGRYLSREADCQLQDLWEKDVLLEVQDVSADQDMTQLMMGSNGFATKFINGPAAPFLARSFTKGFYAKKALGIDLGFENDFLAYLSKGAQAARPRRSSYNVSIRAFPTDTNRDAKLRPHSTLLELQCAGQTTRLENLNYPVAKTFVWTPQSCGDVLFQISVGNLVLTKTYTGYNAFAKFLDEFKTGQHVFMSAEFPDDEPALRRMGITYIKVKYQFQGHHEALEMLYAAPGRPPRKIAPCWDR